MSGTSVRTFAAVFLAAAAQPGWAQAGHRMGGVPEMPAQMLQAGEDYEHHMRYHGGQDEPAQEFPFGRRLPAYDVDVKRFIELELRDGAWRFPQPIKVKPGDIVRFELRNTGRAAHEFRIGDPQYQREHAAMLARMPDVDHQDRNAVTLAPGASKSVVWQFTAEAAVVQLACHRPGHYQAGEVLSVTVEK